MMSNEEEFWGAMAYENIIQSSLEFSPLFYVVKIFEYY